MSIIATPALAAQESLSHAFATARPFRHVVIDGFLEPGFAARLVEDFPRFEERYARNEMGEIGGKAVRMDVRDISDAYRELDRYLQSSEFLGYVSRITGIPDLLYDPDYVGGGTHENRDGQSLAPHVDFNYHPRTKWHRRLNLIVYLNPEWEESWGGNIEFHSDPWNVAENQMTRVLPLLNRAVIFETTETSWHGFSPIRLPPDRRGLSRLSFAVYLYTTERPAAETEVSHATVYVPDAMPAHLHEGHALTTEDCAELERRFAHLRGQLKFLYDCEKQLSAQIDGLSGALQAARDAHRIELQGYARQPRGASGAWPDGWIGPAFSFWIAPTRAARGMSLEIWTPPGLDGAQELEISCGSWQGIETVRAGAQATLRIPRSIAVGDTVEVRIAASRSWVPAGTGGSGDARELSYRLISATVDH